MGPFILPTIILPFLFVFLRPMFLLVVPSLTVLLSVSLLIFKFLLVSPVTFGFLGFLVVLSPKLFSFFLDMLLSPSLITYTFLAIAFGDFSIELAISDISFNDVFLEAYFFELSGLSVFIL